MNKVNKIAGKCLYWFSRPVVGTYTGTMLQMDVHKHEQMPEGAKIIAANHPSTTDPFYVAAMLRQQTFIMIYDLLFQVPVLGPYLHRSGHIPVKGGQGQEAVQKALKYLAAGSNVMIFPEGEISPSGGGFHRAHTGVARLALESGAPVVPVGIHLIRERIHAIRSVVRGQESYGHYYTSGPYNITVGRPLRFKGSPDDRTQVRLVADAVMHHIIELSRESENRMNRSTGIVNEAFGSI